MYELSEVERDFLSQGEADITFHTINTAERLEDSGLLTATWFTQPADHENFGHWRITPAGRAALDEPAEQTGAQAEVAPDGPCTYCKGAGQIVREFYGGAGGFGVLTCPACGGSGKRADEIERRAQMARNEPVFADAPAVDRTDQTDDANAAYADAMRGYAEAAEGEEYTTDNWMTCPPLNVPAVLAHWSELGTDTVEADAICGGFSVAEVRECLIVAAHRARKAEAELLAEGAKLAAATSRIAALEAELHNATTPPSPWPARFLQAAEDAKAARASAERWAQRADALEVRYAALVAALAAGRTAREIVGDDEGEGEEQGDETGM